MLNPADPESAQQIVAEYASVLERHAELRAHPVSIRELPYPKPTIKSAIVTCLETLRQTEQLTGEVRDFLQAAYVGLADYVDEELVRVLTEYRDASAALAEVQAARDKVQTAAWQRVAGTGRLAGEIARTIAEDSATLRREFEVYAAGGSVDPSALPQEKTYERFDV